jgi:hypothetical protein
MNMLPLYLTDLCCIAWLTAFSFLMNAMPTIEVTPEMLRLQAGMVKWIFWRLYGA